MWGGCGGLVLVLVENRDPAPDRHQAPTPPHPRPPVPTHTARSVCRSAYIAPYRGQAPGSTSAVITCYFLSLRQGADRNFALCFYAIVTFVTIVTVVTHLFCKQHR